MLKSLRLITGMLLVSSLVAGCAGLAVEPAAVAVVTPTGTPRPTVTPLLTPSPWPTFTPSPTAAVTPTPTRTPTVTPVPTLPVRPRLAGELGVTIEITAGLTLSGGLPVPTPVPMIELPPGTINVLLIGTDARPGETLGRTDTLIVVSLNPDQNYVTMLSLPRDLYVYIPGANRMDRVNTADLWGSRFKLGNRVDLLAETLRYNLGIPINYYAIVNFDGVRQIIDRLGGIDVLAQCPLYDVFPDLPPGANDIITDTVQLSTVPTGTIDIPTPGRYTLDGQHALWFARSRYSTSDFDRSRRQQSVLKAVWSKIKAQGLISQLPNLWGELTSLVTTDLTLNDVVFLAGFGAQLPDERLKQRALGRDALDSITTDGGAQVLQIVPERVAQVIAEAFEPPLSNVAAQSAASVEVLNATGWAGYAQLAMERLTGGGFLVAEAGAASGILSQTQVINFGATAKGSRLSQLIRLFNLRTDQVVNQPAADSPIDFRILVGRDFDPCKPPPAAVTFPTPTPTPAPDVTPTPQL